MSFQLANAFAAIPARRLPVTRAGRDEVGADDRGRRTFRALLVSWLTICLCALAGQASALTASTSNVTLPVGTYATVTISKTKGEIQAESSNTAVATVSLATSRRATTLTVFGKGAGQATVYVRDKATSNISLAVTVTPSMTVSPTSLSLTIGNAGTITASNVSGSLWATSDSTGVATASYSGNVVTVTGVTAGSTVVSVRDSRTTINVPITIRTSTSSSTTGRHALLAWNDLGMHCVDGKDYSVFSILPPYNNLHAQLVNAATGRAVTSGVTLTYEAVADPTGSINTFSDDVNKTNFWTWVSTVYGVSLPSNEGFTGNKTPSTTPQLMQRDDTNGWFEATGLPITPYDDAGRKNFYPTVKVVAKDLTGKVLASTITVLPVSDEMTCIACHASGSNPDAMPDAGWVSEPDAERAWKLNILRLHDQKQGGTDIYQSALATMQLLGGLYASAVNGKPALCAGCHASNALPGTGIEGISALTSALHTSHGKVRDPSTGSTLDAIDNRSSCYMCHPGSVTRCLRGAMGNALDTNGDALMGCQSCHGNMTKVGDPARVGWLEQPNCQACHYDGTRQTSAVDSSGNLIKPADTRFATNPDAPMTGFSLYRFSKGHGDLQCEACHGSTHAEYPSSHLNDNLQSVALQGYAGTVRECVVCHGTPPLTANGGPHGMHTIGASWVKEHHDYVRSGTTAQCAYCHGSDFRGSDLAQVKTARTFNIGDGRTRSYVAGQNVGCYDCHNGPMR
jgi:hypothetical protein